MPPRLPSPASKLAFPSPNHIALQETNICAQLTLDFLSCERAVLSATSTKLTGPEADGALSGTQRHVGDNSARWRGPLEGSEGPDLISLTCRISGALIISHLAQWRCSFAIVDR